MYFCTFFIFKTKMCKTILDQYFVVSVPSLGQLLLWNYFICNYIALSEKWKQEGNKVLCKNYWASIGCWCTCDYVSLIFVKHSCSKLFLELQKLLMSWFLSKKFLSDVWSQIHLVWHNISTDNLPSLKKIIYRLGVCLCVFVDVKGFTIAEIKLHHI